MECNTVTITASDGRKTAFPLNLLIEKGAIIASKVNGENVLSVMGATNQLWIPGFPAKYFVRDIVGIRFTCEKEPPTLEPFENDGHDFTNRPNVSVKADYVGQVGKPILFEGYANDYDRIITAIQLSLDQGKNWTTYPIKKAEADKWVYWHFEHIPQMPGNYQLKVRSMNEEGTISPIAAIHSFEVLP